MIRSTRTPAVDTVTFRPHSFVQRHRDLLRNLVLVAVGIVGILVLLAAIGIHAARVTLLIIAIVAYVWGCVHVEWTVSRHGLCADWENSKFKHDVLGNILFLGSWVSILGIRMYGRRTGRLQRSR